MRNYLPNHYSKMPNDYVGMKRNRMLSELEEKFIVMSIVDLQTRYNGLKTTHTDIVWDELATNTISFSEFTLMMKVTNNTKHIKDSISDLKSFGISLSYKIFDTIKKKEKLITDYISIFDLFRVNETDGTIQYVFSNYFREFFTKNNSANFFELSISEVVGLNSAHAILEYRLLKKELNKDKKKHSFSVEELKEYHNVEEKYGKYNDFKRKVLEPSKKQINESLSSVFTYDFTEKKEGKKVVGIEFEIFPKEKTYYELNTNKIPQYKKIKFTTNYNHIQPIQIQLFRDLHNLF